MGHKQARPLLLQHKLARPLLLRWWSKVLLRLRLLR